MNIIITGKPGSGKTHLIKNIILRGGEYLTSTTGSAALNLNAKTLHSFLKFTGSSSILSQVNEYLKLHHPKIRTKTIIIDEASMLDRYDFLALKNLYPYTNFILVGDWEQMGPVNGTPIKEEDVDKVFIINEQHRAIDPKLVEFLNNIREANIPEVEKVIKAHTSKCFTKVNISYTNHRKNIVNAILHNKLFVGDTLIFKSHYTEKVENKLIHHNIYDITDKSPFINNCYYEVLELGEVITIRNIITGKSQFIYDKLIPFFFVTDCMTVHNLQGATLDEDVTIILDDLLKSKDFSRLLYVACSRVKKLSQLHFLQTVEAPLTGASRVTKMDKLNFSFDTFQVVKQSELLLQLDACIFNILPAQTNQVLPYWNIYIQANKVTPGQLSTRKLGAILNVSNKTISVKRKAGMSDQEIVDYFNLLHKTNISLSSFVTSSTIGASQAPIVPVVCKNSENNDTKAYIEEQEKQISDTDAKKEFKKVWSKVKIELRMKAETDNYDALYAEMEANGLKLFMEKTFQDSSTRWMIDECLTADDWLKHYEEDLNWK
jgi:hypothetical protein